MTRIVAVCGGRSFGNQAWLDAVMDAEHRRAPIAILIQGGAQGADQLARQWATRWGIAVVTAHANWNHNRSLAGPMRNAVIAALAQEVIAFPGGKGTLNMVNQAEAAGLPVRIQREPDA